MKPRLIITTALSEDDMNCLLLKPVAHRT